MNFIISVIRKMMGSYSGDIFNSQISLREIKQFMSNTKVIWGFRFAVMWRCIAWIVVSYILSLSLGVEGVFFEISGITNQRHSITSWYTWFLTYTAVETSNLRGDLFSRLSSSFSCVSGTGQRSTNQGCWNCFTFPFGSLSLFSCLGVIL
jgi:hypothetical protein